MLADRMRQFLLALVLAAAAWAAAGCGAPNSSRSATASAGSSAPAPRNATLILDFQPNAVHAGIYTALARGLDRQAGVRLHVIAPSASTDSIKLLEAHRVDFAILDLHDLALARERGANLVAVMAIVQRPLASVIAAPDVARPRALQGQTVGVTGAPSDTAVLDSVVAGDGGAPAKVRTVTIGFNAVADLLAGRVAGATAFWNDEGVSLRRRRPGFHIFRVEHYGAPPYPELVVCATASSLHSHPGLARRTVRALVRGYQEVLANPQDGLRALQSRVPGLDPALVAAELSALLPAFRGAGGAVGVLDPRVLSAWARWEVRFGIVRRRPDVAAMFAPGFAAQAGG
jgi:NitT/TauT family transport system substrate-binding protein/putative hydroxymethylpyrimidine transport system substrate-binding protein